MMGVLAVTATVATSSAAFSPRERIIVEALTEAWKAEDLAVGRLGVCEAKLERAIEAAATPDVRIEGEAWTRPLIGCLAGVGAWALADRELDVGRGAVAAAAGCGLGLAWEVSR